MAYGIRFTTPMGDHVQIDSDSTNSGMIVVDSNFTGATTLTNVDLNKDMVFARPSQITIGTPTIAMVNTTGSTHQFVDVDGNAVSCRYVRARWADQIPATTTGYGIQIYNASNQLAFDSNHYTGNGGFGMTHLHPNGSAAAMSNGVVVGPNLTSAFSDDRDIYCLMNLTDRTETGIANNPGHTFSFLGYQWQNIGNAAVEQGVHWLGRFDIFVGSGLGSISSFVGNPAFFVGEAGSV